MSNEEHYFENLLYFGEDLGNSNKEVLSEEACRIIELCADYVKLNIESIADKLCCCERTECYRQPKEEKK